MCMSKCTIICDSIPSTCVFVRTLNVIAPCMSARDCVHICVYDTEAMGLPCVCPALYPCRPVKSPLSTCCTDPCVTQRPPARCYTHTHSRFNGTLCVCVCVLYVCVYLYVVCMHRLCVFCVCECVWLCKTFVCVCACMHARTRVVSFGPYTCAYVLFACVCAGPVCVRAYDGTAAAC